MIYKVMVKQIDVVSVNASSEEQAINIVKSRLDPKALVEIDVCEEYDGSKFSKRAYDDEEEGNE